LFNIEFNARKAKRQILILRSKVDSYWHRVWVEGGGVLGDDKGTDFFTYNINSTKRAAIFSSLAGMGAFPPFFSGFP
jgi:hypothetical protein